MSTAIHDGESQKNDPQRTRGLMARAPVFRAGVDLGGVSAIPIDTSITESRAGSNPVASGSIFEGCD